MLLSPDEAYKIVMDCAQALSEERISLHQSLGYVLAENIVADRDMPPADRSAMDGYALNLPSSVKTPSTFQVIGECPAGTRTRRHVKQGEAMRIYTGANIPPGANSVALVELSEEKDGFVTIRGAVQNGDHIFRKGENAVKGQTLLQKGIVLSPHHIGVCSSVGKSRIRVVKKPSIFVLCTGEEIKEANEKIKIHETRNSNGPMICASLEMSGYKTQYKTLPDNLSLITEELDNATHHFDVIISIGGVSKGKYDFIRKALINAGAKIQFHGISMKPGKPQLFALMKRRTLFYGLPGNPLSALTGFYEFVLPMLKRLSGFDLDSCRPEINARVTERIDNKGDRVRYYLGRLIEQDLTRWVHPVPSVSSADIAACQQINGTIIIPKGTKQIRKGSRVCFRPWIRLA